MTLFNGLFTDILDDMKTYLEAVLDGADRRYPYVFFGPISEGEFFALDAPAVSIQFNGAVEDPKMPRGWLMDVSIIYIKYDPNFTDDYDVVDDSEVLMDDIHDHLEAQNIAGKRMYGDLSGANTYRFDHEDSYVFMFEVKATISRKEV